MAKRKRIAIGGISTECSTYSPLFQTAADFEKVQGSLLVDLVDFPFEKYEIDVHPLSYLKSIPGGPVEAGFYAKTKGEFMEQIKDACPLDGVLLLMHGAMYVPGIEDPEGDWISAVRGVVGKHCIISVCFDLHGNVSDKIIRNIDVFAAYRTAPHIDVKKTYYRAAKHLAASVNGGRRPEVVWSPIPVLVSGEMSSTCIEPCKSIYAQLESFDRRKGILDANLMIGYVWADTGTAIASAVVTCTDQQAGVQTCTEIAETYWQKRNELSFDMRTGDLKAALDWLPNEFSILADSGDNPTAGGVGDRADVLEALIKDEIEGVLVAGITAPGIISKLQGTNKTTVTVGGKLGGGGPDLTLNAENICFKNECAVVKLHGITTVLTERRRPFHNLSDFADLGIDLKDYRLLVVKSGYLSPELQSLSAPSFMVLTDGAVCQHFDRLENKHRQRPIFPFQNPVQLWDETLHLARKFRISADDAA